jgi:hypothetical protein
MKAMRVTEKCNTENATMQRTNLKLDTYVNKYDLLF